MGSYSCRCDNRVNNDESKSNIEKDLDKTNNIHNTDRNKENYTHSLIDITGNTQENSEFYYDNEMIYYGKVINGKKIGYGKLIRAKDNKIIYQGNFIDNLYHGYGKLVEKGLIYQGNFIKGFKHGKGRLFNRDSTYYYEGDWDSNEKHGNGEEHFPDGSYYRGQFYRGKKHGKGKLFFPNDSYYEGDFENGLIEGFGFFSWNINKEYSGLWKNNQLNGFGVLVNYDKTHKGIFKDNRKNGIGIESNCSEGKTFIGIWKNDIISGHCILVSHPKEYTEFDEFMQKSENKIEVYNMSKVLDENILFLNVDGKKEYLDHKFAEKYKSTSEYKDLYNFFITNCNK